MTSFVGTRKRVSGLWPRSWSPPVLFLLFVFIPPFVPIPVSCSVSIAISFSISVPISLPVSLWAFGRGVRWWWWAGWELPRAVCSLGQFLILMIRGWHAVQLRRSRTGQSRVGFLQLKRKKKQYYFRTSGFFPIKQSEDKEKRLDKWLIRLDILSPILTLATMNSQNSVRQWKINTEACLLQEMKGCVLIKDLFIQYFHVRPCQHYTLMQRMLIAEFWIGGTTKHCMYLNLGR